MLGKKTITNIVVITASLALAVLGGLFAPAWIIASALAVLATALLPLGVDLIMTPKPFRGLTDVIRQADEKARLHPLLQQHYVDTIERTEKDLKSILRGRFDYKVSEIPPMSAYAVSLVDERCTLLFPIQTETSPGLFVTDKIGANLYYKQIIETSQLLRDDGKLPVTRVFIFDEEGEISIEVMNFIQKNISDGINVRMIRKLNMPPNKDGLEWNDFGYYEMSDGTSWVMMVRKSIGGIDDFSSDYYVETDPIIVGKYRKYSDAVLMNTTGANTFIEDLKRPVNSAIWPVFFAQEGYEMNPPHGLSVEDAEIIAKSVAGNHSCMGESAEKEVLILGFTPKLIRALQNMDRVNITSIDNISVKPPSKKSEVEYLTSNWLDLGEERKFDAILFDESLNNLSRLQNALFYPILSRALKPGGNLIGRILGHFDEQIAERYKAKTPDEILHALKVIEGDKHEDFAPSIMKFLHSKHVSFDELRSTIDCKLWNQFLRESLMARKISQLEYDLWQISFEIMIFIPDLDFIISNSEASGFTPCEIRKAQGDYLGGDSELGEFYRIVNFEVSS